MKNGSKEPDWGKYGLDGERQPLNPGSSRLEHVEAATAASKSTTNKNLFGGQVVDSNELFADDQVNLSVLYLFLYSHFKYKIVFFIMRKNLIHYK